MESATADAGMATMRTPATAVERAARLSWRGEAEAAAQVLAGIAPATIRRADVALQAGKTCLWLDRLALAEAFLERAAALAPQDRRVLDACKKCRALQMRPRIWETAHRALRAQLERIAQCARPADGASPAHVHIVCKLDSFGGSERRALNLHRALSAFAPATLWSTVPASAGMRAEAPIRIIAGQDAPRGGTLVLSGTYYRCGDWLQTSAFERVVICHNLSEQYADLAWKLSRLEANPSRPRVALTFPSVMFRRFTGLPGTVEYSPVDTEVFCPPAARALECRPLRIGRHGRAWEYKFHPNDPALFRALLANGHRVRVLGGSEIARAFEEDRDSPELLEVGAQGAADFLRDLDVFLYRKHPQFMETGGTVIMEAMATALPVVAFPRDCGNAELIEDGKNGFLVSSEADALARIERLRAEPELRLRLGQAARATIVELMRAQERVLPGFYLERDDAG